jgi:catechol 2,3-dioxygenase-like lactoylglutathione lyase family enzyme
VSAEITSPIMRFLAVKDVARSCEFYRELLGFEVTEEPGGAEAILGPARIRFEKEGQASGAGHALRMPGSAVLFLQTGDVVGLRSAINTRGGIVSEIEKVNWIKMRMFEVRDPDGNVLWFGQTYHEEQDSPSRRGAQPHGLRQALPEVPFDNVPAAVDYYCDVLGFRINYRQDDLGVVDRDAITVLLIARTGQHQGIGSFGVYVDDADALFAELSAKGARVQGAPVSHPWGLRNFSVLDLEGNRITFSQTFE